MTIGDGKVHLVTFTRSEPCSICWRGQSNSLPAAAIQTIGDVIIADDWEGIGGWERSCGLVLAI